ncbi:MAG: 50S ribosomal protein L24 [Desulfobacterales bacterium]|jgi:large subunit ribosomal protein L24|nr:50S ribosomal protein L24 [Desulfobacterales bacterium]
MIENRSEIKKDDKVKVIAGKDKGKIGKVVKVIRKTNKILVEHVNVVKRHTRPTAKNKQGGIVAGEAPVHVSNVMLMCNKCIKPVRIKMQKLENGKKARVCQKCSEIIDK